MNKGVPSVETHELRLDMGPTNEHKVIFHKQECSDQKRLDNADVKWSMELLKQFHLQIPVRRVCYLRTIKENTSGDAFHKKRPCLIKARIFGNSFGSFLPGHNVCGGKGLMYVTGRAFFTGKVRFLSCQTQEML